MKTTLAIVLALILIGGAIFLFEKHDADTGGITATSTQSIFSSSTPVTGQPQTGSTSTPSVATADITITSPRSGETVSSPLSLAGKARGTWFFEAVAPVYLEDASGKKIATGQIRATGDWMTTNLVPFTGTLTWTASSTGTTTAARIVFMNDNPSGNPATQKTVTVPVVLAR